MRLTTKGRYAVTAMLDLALRSDKGPVSLAEISGRQGISLSYLEQLFAKLRSNDLVSSVRGPGGGYRLSRDATQISVAQIIDAVNESVDATSCGGEGDCHQGEKCLTHDLWTSLNTHIFDYLKGVKLSTLVDEQIARRGRVRADGNIVVEMAERGRGGKKETEVASA